MLKRKFSNNHMGAIRRILFMTFLILSPAMLIAAPPPPVPNPQGAPPPPPPFGPIDDYIYVLLVVALFFAFYTFSKKISNTNSVK